jgi:hypothetical protein
MPVPAPEQDRVFPFFHEELHLTGHGRPVQPIKFRCRIVKWFHVKFLLHFSHQAKAPDGSTHAEDNETC